MNPVKHAALVAGLLLAANIAPSFQYVPIYDSLTGSTQAQIAGPIGYYGCGVALRLQLDPTTKVIEPDAAANGLKLLYCSRANWSQQKEVAIIDEGLEGTWFTTKCGNNSFINGAQLQTIVVLDSAINGLNISCQNIETGNSDTVKLETPNPGAQQDSIAFDDQYVCGAQSRIHREPKNLELTGLKLKFCNKRLVKSVNISYNKEQETITTGGFSLKVQTFLNPTQENTTEFINIAQKFETKYEWENEEGYYGMITNSSFERPEIDEKGLIQYKQVSEVEWVTDQAFTANKTVIVSRAVNIENCTTFTVDLVGQKVDVQIPYTAEITLEDGTVKTLNGTWKGFTVIYLEDGKELGIFSLQNGQCPIISAS